MADPIKPGPSDPIPSPDKVQHWAVEVRVDGVGILTIESECLSGIPNIDDYAVIVRRCAAHLNAFIGDEPNETAGGFPVAAAPYQAEETGVISGTRQDPQHRTPHGSGVTAGETAPIPSQPDEREAIARIATEWRRQLGWREFEAARDGLTEEGKTGLYWIRLFVKDLDAILAMQAERERNPLNRMPADVYWLIGKGKTRPDEPLYGVQLLEPDSNKIIAEAEHDDLAEAIAAAIRARAAAERGM